MLINLLLCVLGIVLYTLIKSRSYFKDGKFDVNIFYIENIFCWIWSFLICLCVTFVLEIAPEAAEVLSQISGLNIESSKSGFLIMGFMASFLSKENQKSEIKN